METNEIIADNNLELFVRDILILESQDRAKKCRIPLFADGYPGIIYLRSEKSAFLLPWKKQLNTFFLYGQTIEPIELSMNGSYMMIVFQLYPFASRLLFGVDPRRLNNDCYNLSTIREANMEQITEKLTTAREKELQIRIIAQFIAAIARKKGLEEYREIQNAIEIVVRHNGLITVQDLARRLDISERTLQRKFSIYIGMSPKKFAKIIQFQSSVEQISAGGFSKLTEIAYENGYSDQSHFIRNIKKFTGKRPLQLRS